MILRFGAKNFCSFKEWLVIDLTFNSKVPNEIRGNLNYSRLMCLKGANSSGKTSALKALAFIKYFTTNSFKLKPDENIAVDSHFMNNEPSEFFVDFIVGKTEYSYELILSKAKVFKERLYKKHQRKRLVLSRIDNTLEINTLLLNTNIIVRQNASVISTANQYQVEGIRDIYTFFDNITSNVYYYGLRKDWLDYRVLSKEYNNSKERLQFVKEMINLFDPAVEDILIQSFVNDKNEEVFFPKFLHCHSNGKTELKYEEQSSGTKSLYLQLVLYFDAFANGGVLALDEFDINLHPDMVEYLVKMFDSEERNKGNAQLIFSTHNQDIMDVMGKYRTYLFNKENGDSYCYRLDELPENIIRNDRPITPLYKTGKIGGVPVLP